MKRSKLTPLNKLSENHSSDNSRRSFLKRLQQPHLPLPDQPLSINSFFFSSPVSGKAEEEENIPWFRKIARWGQTNITERSHNIHIEWWRQLETPKYRSNY